MPARGQHVLAALQLHPAVGERVMLAVLDDRHHLDRRDGGRLQPREPAERRPGRAAEGVVREPRRAAGDRVHAAELRVHEREQQDRGGADDPGDDRGGPGGGQRALRAEEPAGPDDRAGGRPEEADEPDLPPQPGASPLSRHARRRGWATRHARGSWRLPPGQDQGSGAASRPPRSTLGPRALGLPGRPVGIRLRRGCRQRGGDDQPQPVEVALRRRGRPDGDADEAPAVDHRGR